MERQHPAAIVRDASEVAGQTVGETSDVELIQELIRRTGELRTELTPDRADAFARMKVEEKHSLPSHKFPPIARDLSLAITHLEDARTRLNAARYRLAGRFSISDAERS